MKKHIENIKAKGPEHAQKVAKIFAGITTGVIVIIWIVLLVVLDNNNEEERVEPSNGPAIENFLQQAEDSLDELGSDYQQGRENFQQTMEAAEEAPTGEETEVIIIENE